MKKIIFVLAATVVSAAGLASLETFKKSLDVRNSLVTNTKQITFVGPRSGEGYYSHDGKKMVFQSERYEGNPFYQIYLMDLQTGKSDLISTGKGKTTCAWVHPNGDRVMFSSTHLDPDVDKKVKAEYETRANPQKNRYSWSFDNTFDIFEYNLKSLKLKRLTQNKGYNAEGSYSPDGKYIAFASNRAGYTDTLSAEDKKIFEMDPSYMMDIYIMKADGTQVKRLTDTKGYDGGPFFSSDGKKITWRRFAPNGQTAEIYTMNVDGSDQKQITHLGAMSWAPFFHPSNDYIVFTSNVLGFANFELFVVDVEGKKDPVRVTFWDGFDGLPTFSPDGKKLSWTHRNEKGESQIYVADWDDGQARRLLGLAPEPLHLSDLDGSPASLHKLVGYLASPELEGRATGSDQELVYMNEIARLVKEMGYRSVLKSGEYLQSFEYTSGVELTDGNSLKIETLGKTPLTKSFKPAEQYTPMAASAQGEFSAEGIVFAGYGIVAPASDKAAKYDSYEGLDVKDKWVMVLKDLPQDVSTDMRSHLSLYSRPQHKSLQARRAGAKGIIFISDENENLAKLKIEPGSEESIAVLNLTWTEAVELLKQQGFSLVAAKSKLDHGEIINDASVNFALKVSTKIAMKQIKSTGHSLVFASPDAFKSKNVVMLGAHGDHLGHGLIGNSLAQSQEKGKIHFGADDNASGVAALMTLAKQSEKYPRVFAVWSGEEVGLLGSSYFLKHLRDTKLTAAPKAYLNMDMVGRLRDSLYVQGVGSAKEFKEISEHMAQASNLALNLQDDPYQPTDSMAFYLENIPSVTLFTGVHGEYHTPRDTADSLNYEGLAKVAEFMKGFARHAASAKLTYVKVEGSRKQLGGGRAFRVYLGTVPDYTQEGVKGVRLSGVSKDGPAEKAGVKAQDVIVELDHKHIENLYDYTYALQAMKTQKQTEVKVLREGKELTLQITPVSKE